MVKLSDYPLDIKVLNSLNTFADLGAKISYDWNPNSISLNQGEPIEGRLWHRMLCELTRKGLVAKERGKAYAGSSGTITRYWITSKGQKLLKELGL